MRHIIIVSAFAMFAPGAVLQLSAAQAGPLLHRLSFTEGDIYTAVNPVRFEQNEVIFTDAVPSSGEIRELAEGENVNVKPDEQPEPADTETEIQDDVNQKITLEEAVAKLNHEDDSHWTEKGKPDLNILSELTGETVTRKILKESFPDLVRTAKDAA